MKLILAETHYWDSAPRVDSHHLALHLARRGHEILYLSSPLSILHFLQRKNWRHKYFRATRYGGKGRLITPGLRALVPFTWAPVQTRFPLDSPAQLRRTLSWTTPSLRKTMAGLGFGSPDALIIQSLFFAHLPEWFANIPVLYRMTDDFEAFPGMPKALVQAESQLVQRAQIVTVCSALLIQRAQAMGARQIELLPHGVDAELFEEAQHRAKPTTSRQRAVYVGAIDSWFRADCVAAAARLFPSVDFELAGPIGAADLSSIANLPNVRLVGPIPFAQVPAFVQGAKIGLIPFKRTPLIEPVRPLKLFEYLAAGLAVVATRWTELESLNAPIQLADTAEQFATAVGNALLEPATEEGIAFAREQSWDRRATALEQMILQIRRG